MQFFGKTLLCALVATTVLTTAAYSRFFASEAFNQGIQRATRCSNTIVRQYAASHRTVGFIDLNRFVCPDGTTCLTQLDGSELRSDVVWLLSCSIVRCVGR